MANETGLFGLGYLFYCFMLFVMTLPFVWASRREWVRRLRWPVTILFVAWLVVAISAAYHLRG